MTALAGAAPADPTILSVEEARRAIADRLARPGPLPEIIVDFDETLWLRNTTEDYLSSLRPRLLARALLLAVDLLRPWALIGSADAPRLYRDWIRTAVCTVLMPWNLLFWRLGARARAARFTNHRLLGWLDHADRRPLQVATLGLDLLVRPILRHIDPEAELVAAGTLLSGYRIRRDGKEAAIEARRPGLLADAIVITDSPHDADILARASTPVLVTWPEARYSPAFADGYIPFLYTQRAKRPGENYMLYGVLLEDVVHLWLAFAWTMTSPLAGALGLLLLHLGFFAVYELGYHENDVLASHHEAKPKIKPEAARYAHRVRPFPAWCAGLVLSLPGLALLWRTNAESLVTSGVGLTPTAGFAALAGLWIAYLALARALFWVYNRLDTGSRGLFYVALQIVRLSGYALLLRVDLVGGLLLLSLVLARWVKYLAYRDTGRTLTESQRLLMLAFFVVLWGSLCPLTPSALVSAQAAAACLWLALYAHQRLRALLRGVRLHSFAAPAAGPVEGRP